MLPLHHPTRSKVAAGAYTPTRRERKFLNLGIDFPYPSKNQAPHYFFFSYFANLRDKISPPHHFEQTGPLFQIPITEKATAVKRKQNQKKLTFLSPSAT